MNEHQHRIDTVLYHFKDNDTFLAYRRMLDCVMDTDNMSLYQEAIMLTAWKESNPKNTEELVQRAIQLLEKVRQCTISAPNIDQPIIVGKDLEKSYGYNRFSLGPISLEIKKGQVYGLVGENGNGKTTLLRMLAKELSLSKGSIDFAFDNRANDHYGLRTKLIYIPQRTEKWYGSLKDNLRFVLSNYKTPPQEIETRMMMMICRLGLWQYQHLQWSELSSGYKMRFELARTLLRKPEILLLDEPLANLDVMAQQVILEDLKYICNSINKPIALILSSQQLYEVEKVSDKVIFLKNGKYDEKKQSTEIEDIKNLIVEIDSDASKDQLQQAFDILQIEKLNFNGGVFIAQFAKDVAFSDVLMALANSRLKVVYIRDISISTRRFFIS